MRSFSLVAVFGAVLIGGVMTGSLLSAGQGATQGAVVGGAYPNYTVAELARRADAIAVIVPTGQEAVHWNNAANEPWALERVGIDAHIYRDVQVSVVRVFHGNLDQTDLTIRAVGGTVRDFQYEYEYAAHFEPGVTYVALLRQADTPTREGFERFWTVVWESNGLFVESAPGIWTNEFGKSFTDIELRDLLPSG